MNKVINSQLKVSNYNRTCDCLKQCALIEKDSEYYYVTEGKHKFAVSVGCHDEFIIWLENSK